MAIKKPYKKRLIVCFVSVLLVLCFHHFASKQIKFVEHSKGYLKIQDYAYYIIIAKAFWFEGFGNIYKLAFQQRALSAFIGSNIKMVMPLGITPIALIVWFPFAYVARFSMSLSYTLWITLSVGVLSSTFWWIGRFFHQMKTPQLLPIMLFFVTVFSMPMFRALYLGQTSGLAAGLLIYLIIITHKLDTKYKLDIRIFIVLSIFVLGIKPTYLALGLGILIIYGMWREAIYSLVVVIFALLIITPFLTKEWLFSYYQQVSIFGREAIPEFYAWAFAPHTMNIFRSAFRNIIGDKIARSISTLVTFSVFIGVIGYSILLKIGNVASDKLFPLKVTKGQLFVLVAATYFLFAPYAGSYEDVLLLSIFVMVLLVGDSLPLTNYKSIFLICILFFILNHNAFPLSKPLWLFWIFKAVLLGYMLNFCGPRKERKGFAD